jgi:GTP cyclohydrolase II
MDSIPDRADPGRLVAEGVTIRTQVQVPLRFADGYTALARVTTFRRLADGQEHLALAFGDQEDWGVPLVRLHSECLTGDVFGSTRCDCGPQLRESVERIAGGGGVLLYLRQEGRGIGLYNKLDAYALQDAGLDTYEANTALGFVEDARDYTAAAQMLAALGVARLDLLTNNPDKAGQLREHGVAVRRTVPTGVFASESNLRYLQAKAEHTRHTILLPVGPDVAVAAG